MSTKKPKQKAGGKWVFLPDNANVAPSVRDEYEAQVANEEKLYDISTMVNTQIAFNSSMESRFAAIEEFQNYFPGTNKLPPEGAWVLVKNPPFTEYTVPPFSIWFGEPWEHGQERHSSNRIKIVTPRGELGLYPREYSLIEKPEKYYEFIGEGLEVKFFGNEDGVPKEPLFYLRSRGIAKKDALIMLIGQVKAHGVMWIEASREICKTLGKEWPSEERLATI